MAATGPGTGLGFARYLDRLAEHLALYLDRDADEALTAGRLATALPLVAWPGKTPGAPTGKARAAPVRRWSAPGRHPKADPFDVTWADKEQLAFGHGAHFCFGAPPARRGVAPLALFTRFDSVCSRPRTAPRPPVCGSGLRRRGGTEAGSSSTRRAAGRPRAARKRRAAMSYSALMCAAVLAPPVL
nr:hypothetical protein KPHV_84130 [Kitasatospora purpeofusca]